MQEKRSHIQMKPVSILSTITEKPPLAKVDIYKVNNENKLLKQNLANKEFEINELKKQLKQLMNGFQMIKINSDNTHIDLAGSKHDITASKTGKMKMAKSFMEFNQHNRNYSKDELINSLERATSKEEIIKKLSQNHRFHIQANKSVDFNNPSLSRNVISASHSRAASFYSQKNSPELSDGADDLYFPTQTDDPRLKKVVKKVLSKAQLPKLTALSNVNSSSNLREVQQSTSAEKLIFSSHNDSVPDVLRIGNTNALTQENSQLKEEIAKLKKENEDNKSRLMNISNNFSNSVTDIRSLKRDYDTRIKSLTSDLSFSISELNRIQKIVNKQTELIFKYKKEKEQIQGKQ